MKSRSEVWLSALDELGALCSVDTTRDSLTVTRRVENEGDVFFTKTLPAYARYLERSLAVGQVPSHLFVGWSRLQLDIRVHYTGAGFKTKKSSHGGVPKFLGGFMDIIFNSTPDVLDVVYSRLVSESDYGAPMRVAVSEDETARIATAIWAVRQLCLMFSKEKELCSDDLVEAAIARYVAHDRSLVDPFQMTGQSGYFSWTTWLPSGESWD